MKTENGKALSYLEQFNKFIVLSLLIRYNTTNKYTKYH